MGNLLSGAGSKGSKLPPGTPLRRGEGAASASGSGSGSGSASALAAGAVGGAAAGGGLAQGDDESVRNPSGPKRDPQLQEMCALLRQCLVELPRAVTTDFEYQSLDLVIEKVEDDDKLLEVVLAAALLTMPLTNPLASGMITILIDSLPLPTKKLIPGFQADLALWYPTQGEGPRRNFLVVQAALGEKLAGHLGEICMVDAVQDLLMDALRRDRTPLETLFAVIACEKMALTGANKQKLLRSGVSNLLCLLEAKYCMGASTSAGAPDGTAGASSSASGGDGGGGQGSSASASAAGGTGKEAAASSAGVRGTHVQHERDRNAACIAAQIGFCATWALDNVFPSEGRVYAAMRADLSAVNVMLDQRDATKNLKLAPDGLEIRNDSFMFESVRATCSAAQGSKWYYEVTLFTSAIMQLGWATAHCRYLAQDGCGIGDDEHSFAYDGCRRLLWHRQEFIAHAHPQWRPGDVVGLYLDLTTNKCDFSLNGKRLGMQPIPVVVNESWYPAASLMTFQHVRFNFGDKPYRFPPPDDSWRSLNGVAQLDQELKKIVPRLMALEMLSRTTSVDDDSPQCQICFDSPPTVMHLPCRHAEFCEGCSVQLDNCPLCRRPIEDREMIKAPEQPSEQPPSTG